MKGFRFVQDIPAATYQGAFVLVRLDLNVPMDCVRITDDTRILAAIPTIQYLIDRACRVVVISHLGQPKGVDHALSLAPVAERLSVLLKKKVVFASDCLGVETKNKVEALQAGEVILLENLRFYSHEVNNDLGFSEQLSQYGQFFVQDAFGTLHRAHASTVGIPHFLPAAVGFLVQKEIQALKHICEQPKRPFVGIIGGSKISSKIGILRHLLGKVDTLVIGGGMAFTFFKAQGYEIGCSLCEVDKVDEAKKFLEEAAHCATKVLFPSDHVVADSVEAKEGFRVVATDAIGPQDIGVDIGPHTVACIANVLSLAKTVIWNGPLGIFENPFFAKGTLAVAQVMAGLDATTVVGGGDSVAALNQAGLSARVTHISTGGGASLAFLEGKELPGLVALEQDNG